MLWRLRKIDVVGVGGEASVVKGMKVKLGGARSCEICTDLVRCVGDCDFVVDECR